MPELPEVETVKKELEKVLLGKTFGTPIIYYKPLIHTPYDEFITGLNGKKIHSLSRKGKYLLLHLDDEYKLVFHLRMEGKLFVVPEKHTLSHLTMYIPFLNDEGGLAFYDVRKFGTVHYCKEDDNSVFKNVGLEPFEIDDDLYLFAHYHSSKKYIKELLLDQSIMCGLGNIYADEVLFRSHVSPFKRGRNITRDECDAILENSKKVLQLAIESNGLTIRTYKASESVHGDFQQFLRVYGRKGQLCAGCRKHYIERKIIGGRSASYCPYCQKTGVSVAVTGKIASGKSLVSSIFKEAGFVFFSCDEEVHRLYKDTVFLKELKKKFPMIFKPTLNKDIITSLLHNDLKFKRRYEEFIFANVKKAIDSFLIEHDGRNKVVEVPLLFDAHMENLFTFLVGVETTKQKQHLQIRGEDENRASFNQLNSYDKHRDELDYIIENDGSIEELRIQVKKIIADMTGNNII